MASAATVRCNRDCEVAIEAIKPPRLNFAHICLYCDGRDCQSPVCIARHERSRWAVCLDCAGLGWSELVEPCECMFGVVETWPEPAEPDRPREA